MRIFRFLQAKYGKKAIEERRLKLATPDSLNDPFELLPFKVTTKERKLALEQHRKAMDKTRGLLCCSKSWKSPIMWAHYAESHKGICLELEALDTLCTPVSYISAPLPFDGKANEEVVNQMLYTKFDGWSYEEEVRLWATADERENGMAFVQLGSPLELKQVILGAACSDTTASIGQLTAHFDYPVEVIRARRSDTRFEMRAENQRDLEFDKYSDFFGPLMSGATPVYPKVGRNDLCPCKSGKKFKLCHGR